MKIILRIFGYAKKLNLFIPQYIIFVLLGVIFSVFNLALIVPLLDVLFKQETAEVIVRPESFELSTSYLKDSFYFYFTQIIDQYGEKQALLFVCVVVLTSVLMANLFRYLSAIISARIRLDVVKYLRMDIFNKVSRMHLGYFSNERRGDLISRVTNDVQEVEVSILNSPKALFKEPVTILIYFIALFLMSFKLTLFTLIILPTAGGALAYLVKKLKRKATQSQDSLGRIVNILDETLGGMRIIKAFNAREYVQKRIDDETSFFRRVNLSYSIRKELGSPISEFLGICIVTIILWVGGSYVLDNDSTLSASGFIAYLVIFSQIISPAKAFSTGVSEIQKGIASGRRIFKVIDTIPEIQNKPNAKVLDGFKEKLVFENVSFSYEKDQQVLKNVNLVIEKGKTIALVGQSGGGKSTLADLIPRFYDVTDGDIKIDGVSLKDLNIDSVRKQMGIVTQESILFNDTIFNNIAFGIEGADEEAVINAAKIANAHNFIIELENGYQTNIGERGLKLSGGQRQRLSIARAVLKNPPILILDEATSALDSESEKLVQEALGNLMQNRTSIVIAHRLSTIQHADEIVVIQSGEVIERGTHKELLAKGGTYKKLSGMQNT